MGDFWTRGLRKSARELLIEMNHIRWRNQKRCEKHQEKKPASKIPFSEEVAEIFEKWRRGDYEVIDDLKFTYCIIFLSDVRAGGSRYGHRIRKRN